MTSVRRIFKIIGYTLGAILFLVVFLAGFTQTKLFKERLRAFLVSELSANVNGSVVLGTIKGNFLTQFEIDSVTIYYGGQEFFSSGTITYHHDPLTLLNKTLHISELKIEHPRISFIRSKSGEWNITKLFKPSGDTSKAGFDWTINLNSLEIKDASVSLFDSLSLSATDHPQPDDRFFEYHNFSVDDVNIKCNARIQNDNINVNIDAASGYSVSPQIQLTTLKGEFSLTAKGINAKKVIIQTGGSYLELDAQLKGANVFKGFDLPDLQHDSIRLRFVARNIDFGELKTFLPPVGFLEGSALVELDVEGEFGNLTIDRLNLGTYQSAFDLYGSLKNLHDPDKLYLDVNIVDGKFIPSDVSKLLSYLNVPPFPSVGSTSLSVHYVGTPSNFAAKGTFSGSFGRCNIDGSLNLERNLPHYEVKFTTDSLDIGPIAGETSVRTSLFVHGNGTGDGFSPETMTSQFLIDIDSARVQDVTIDSSQIVLNALPKRLEVTSSLNGHDMNASISGHVDFSVPHVPSVGGQVSLRSFDLSRIVNDEAYESDLSLEAKIQGSGSTLDNLNGEAMISLKPSTIRRKPLAEQKIIFSIDQRDRSQKHLRLRSELADAELSGKFDVDLLATSVSKQVLNIIHKISQHTSPVDTATRTDSKAQALLQRHTRSEREVEFTYHVNVKDIESVASVVSEEPFNAKGIFEGSIKGTDERMSITCNGALDEFFVGHLTDGVLFRDGTVHIDVRNAAVTNSMEQISGTVNLDVGSAIVANHTIDSLKSNLQYDDTRGSLSFSGVIDSSFGLVFNGVASVQPTTYVFDLEKVSFGSNSYVWKNIDDVQLRIDQGGFRIAHALMEHRNESIALTGSISDSGLYDLTSTVKGFDLSGLQNIVHESKTFQPGVGFEGYVSGTVHLGGTAAEPVINVEASGTDMSYRSTSIGAVGVNMHYENKSTDLELAVRSSPTDTVPSLIMKGTVPMDLALTGVKKRFLDSAQNLHVVSQGFNIGVLEPVLREFENLNGIVYCDVTMAGTPLRPEYSGNLSLRNARFTFMPNNVAYEVSGNLTPSGERLILNDVLIKNLSEDKFEGEARVNGTVLVRNFAIDSLNLKIHGTMLLMTDATRKALPTMYGNLFTEIDPSGLDVKGTFENPYLSGKLYIRDANLIFPPKYLQAYAGTSMALPYEIVDDTSRPTEAPSIFSKKFYSVIDSGKAGPRRSISVAQSTLIDRLRYDVTVETQGPTRVTLVFTPSTNEELYAELDGKVSAVNQTGTPQVYGEIAVSSRSYYNWIKKFEASGKLKYVGQPDNPELDIKATYEGYGTVPEEAKQTQSGNQEATSPASNKKKIIVLLTITGTRYEPKLDMSLRVQLEEGADPVDWSTRVRGGDVQSDAISFILTGKFRDELNSRDREGIISNVGASTVTSTFLSGIFSDFLRKEFPFISRAEVSYGGGNLQESADLRLSGEAFKGYWRFGGRILNDIGNANVNYRLSLGEVFNVTSIRNLFIELERKVEGSEISRQDKATNAARLYYRFSF